MIGHLLRRTNKNINTSEPFYLRGHRHYFVVIVYTQGEYIQLTMTKTEVDAAKKRAEEMPGYFVPILIRHKIVHWIIRHIHMLW